MPSLLLPVLNTLAGPFTLGPRGPRHPEAAVRRMAQRAAKAAGAPAPDLDHPELRNFAFLVEQFAAADHLSPIGWASVTLDLQTRLANWLRVQRLHAEHPELEAEDVSDPVFIVGLPRTATTLTHHLLANAERHRGTRLWELLHPALPLSDTETATIITGVERGQQLVRLLIPEMVNIHPQAATRPDETAFLFFHGPQHQARALMPAYAAWEADRNPIGDYQYLKQVLQVLQHGREPRRWVLKNPIHLGSLRQLLQVFPNATIVWMHREPRTVIGSLCSLVETSHRLHLRRVDRQAIGRMCLDMLSGLVDAGRDARTTMPPGHIIDVPYDWLTAAPFETVPRLYDLIGAHWTARDENGLASILARPSGARRHDYAASWYGLDDIEIDQRFGDYGKFALAAGPERH